MKINLKQAICNVTVCSFLLSTVFMQTAQSQSECYTRLYDKTHFNKPENKNQTIQEINLKIYNTATRKEIEVDAWKYLDSEMKKHTASLTLVATNQNSKIYCDTTNGEWKHDHSRGCLIITNKKRNEKGISTRLLSPVDYEFDDDRGYNMTKGVVLTHCSGKWNDGYICIIPGGPYREGKVSELSLKTQNSADLNYKVEKTKCKNLK
jgi:hypothetical protein